MKNNSLCIGDVVLFREKEEASARKFVITHIDPKTGYVSGIGADGHMFADKNPSKWKKTGDYCPVVEELLRESVIFYMGSYFLSAKVASKPENLNNFYNPYYRERRVFNTVSFLFRPKGAF